MNVFRTIFLLCAALTANAWATTSVTMKECPNCTSAQMQNGAKNSPPGMAFVYDLAHHVIHKYEVYLDSTCGPSGPSSGIADRKSDGAQIEQAGDNGVNCGTFRAADEMVPVDSNIQAIFDALFHVSQINPALAATGEATREGTPPTDPSTGQPFDLRKVAWDYPQGSFLRLNDLIQNTILASSYTADNFVPGLGDLIFQVNIPLTYPQQVQDPGHLIISVVIHIDRSITLVHLQLCTDEGDCGSWDIPVNGGQPGKIQFKGVFDSEQMMYPSASGQMPGGLRAWNWGNRGDADHFGQGLRNNGWDVPGAPNCNPSQWRLVIATVNGHFDSATWTCGAY